MHHVFLAVQCIYMDGVMKRGENGNGEEERSRSRAVQMDNLRGLLGIRRMDSVPNSRIRELCGVRKGLDGRFDEGVLWWFSHVERMERNRIANRVYIGECAGSRSVG